MNKFVILPLLRRVLHSSAAKVFAANIFQASLRQPQTAFIVAMARGGLELCNVTRIEYQQRDAGHVSPKAVVFIRNKIRIVPVPLAFECAGYLATWESGDSL